MSRVRRRRTGLGDDIGHPVERGVFGTLAKSELQNQDRHWSRHAERYDEVFLDPYAPGVENPLWAALDAIPDAAHKTAADLGCGTGPLLPHLAERFERVIALDFAPGMIERARERLAPEADDRVTFLQRPDARPRRPRRAGRRRRRDQLARHARRPPDRSDPPGHPGQRSSPAASSSASSRRSTPSSITPCSWWTRPSNAA